MWTAATDRATLGESGAADSAEAAAHDEPCTPPRSSIVQDHRPGAEELATLRTRLRDLGMQCQDKDAEISKFRCQWLSISLQGKMTASRAQKADCSMAYVGKEKICKPPIGHAHLYAL